MGERYVVLGGKVDSWEWQYFVEAVFGEVEGQSGGIGVVGRRILYANIMKRLG